MFLFYQREMIDSKQLFSEYNKRCIRCYLLTSLHFKDFVGLDLKGFDRLLAKAI